MTASPPIIFSIDLCPFNTSNCKSTLVTNSLGGSVTIDLTDTPPLQPGGTYTVRICNLGVTPITLNIKAIDRHIPVHDLPAALAAPARNPRRSRMTR